MIPALVDNLSFGRLDTGIHIMGVGNRYHLIGISVEDQYVVEPPCFVQNIKEQVFFKKTQRKGRPVAIGVDGNIFDGSALYRGRTENASANLGAHGPKGFPGIYAGGASHAGTKESQHGGCEV